MTAEQHLSGFTPLPVPVPVPSEAQRRQIRRVTLAYVVTGLFVLTIGVFFGPLQALNYGGYDTYEALQPGVQSYYQGLTLHGVMNAYAFTTFFMSGLMYYLTARELEAKPSGLAA